MIGRRLEWSFTGLTYAPLPTWKVRQLLATWRRHEGAAYVHKALSVMRQGEVFITAPLGVRYRIRGSR